MKQKITTVGILGGGQLGRMSALAGARLGLKSHIYCPEPDCPASQVTDLTTISDYNNEDALKKFADSVDVITYEFENIPLETVDFLAKFKPVYPSRKLLEISQDRLKEKSFLNSIGIETARWAACNSPNDITQTLMSWQTSKCILKTTRFGYDGKGQLKHDDKKSTSESFLALGNQTLIIEEIIDFELESSVIVARDTLGKISIFPPTVNNHKNHILSESIAPARLDTDIIRNAMSMASALAEAVDLVGVLALELFITKDGKLIANEIAPRTHNSGHWTMDGCNVSQFEQHMRAVSGLPVLNPVQHSAVTMINLIGDDVLKLPEYLAMDNACVHLYGKAEARE
ncbi:MAG: 5-(carboxyamino)imidazole ribonucleotide synthase, partial [Micavibrio aeruginosavorus]